MTVASEDGLYAVTTGRKAAVFGARPQIATAICD